MYTYNEHYLCMYNKHRFSFYPTEDLWFCFFTQKQRTAISKDCIHLRKNMSYFHTTRFIIRFDVAEKLCPISMPRSSFIYLGWMFMSLWHNNAFSVKTTSNYTDVHVYNIEFAVMKKNKTTEVNHMCIQNISKRRINE